MVAIENGNEFGGGSDACLAEIKNDWVETILCSLAVKDEEVI